MGVFPKLHDTNIEDIDSDLILKIIEKACQKKEFIVTPLKILGVTGFPTQEQKLVLSNKDKIKKIKEILVGLESQGILEKRKSKQDHLGIKEVGYNYLGKP